MASLVLKMSSFFVLLDYSFSRNMCYLSRVSTHKTGQTESHLKPVLCLPYESACRFFHFECHPLRIKYKRDYFISRIQKPLLCSPQCGGVTDRRSAVTQCTSVYAMFKKKKNL